MIETIDNFLNESELNFLRSYAHYHIDHITLNKLGNSYINFSCQSGNINDIRHELGLHWVQILNKLNQQLIQLINFDLLLFSIKISITTDQYKMFEHLDNNVHNRVLTDSFTCIIYLNDVWDENMGGFWSDGNILIEPKPNRLLVYSRDIKHSVTPALCSWINNRIIFLTSWAKC